MLLQSPKGRRLFVDARGQPTPFAYQVAADIGQGVAALHERGIVHRDLKPQNVLLTDGGRWVRGRLEGAAAAAAPSPAERWPGWMCRESLANGTPPSRAKLSDMGLSKRLLSEQLSFESVGSGGSSGWQAPEQLISRSGGTARQTNSGVGLGAG